jgi:transposase
MDRCSVMQGNHEDLDRRRRFLEEAKGGAYMQAGDAWLDLPAQSGMMFLHGWVVNGVETQSQPLKAYHIFAEYDEAAKRVCKHCGTIDDCIKFGIREQVYKDIPAHAHQMHIHVFRKRYRCQSCHKTFMQNLPHMDTEHMMTKRLAEYIGERSLEQTFTSLAKEIGVSEGSIRLVFGEYVETLEAEREHYTPKWLGIDELKLVGDYRAIFTDILNRRPIELLKRRTKPIVAQYLSTLDADCVELVVMDMWPTYRDVVRDLFPNARIVVDKFHIFRMANEAMEKVRKRTRAELSDRQRRQLKKDRQILLRRQFELSENELMLLSAWVENFADLGKAYQMKEAYSDIWNTPDRLTAQARYRQWKAAMPESIADAFHELIRAMDNWHDEIFAYFDTGITNAYTEAINGVIKHVNRAGRGYSFPAIRAKLLFNAKRRPIKPFEMLDIPGDSMSEHGLYDHLKEE